MSFTAVEETQLKDLLVDYEGLKDVGADAAALLAELGAGDVTVLALPAAAALQAPDVLYVAQSGADVKATIQQLADYVQSLLTNPTSVGQIYFMGQN